MKLLIDSASDITQISIEDNQKLVASMSVERERRSQVVLKMINDLKVQKNLEWADFEEIEVNKGPGSFTGLRVGVAIANALAYGLKIKVNEKFVEMDLVYS